MWLLNPLWSMWAPYFKWAPLLDSSRTFRYPVEIFRNLSDASENHFPYMNLILRTLSELLVMWDPIQDSESILFHTIIYLEL